MPTEKMLSLSAEKKQASIPVGKRAFLNRIIKLTKASKHQTPSKAVNRSKY